VLPFRRRLVGNYQLSFSDNLNLVPGDYVEVQLQNQNGTAVQVIGANSSFSVQQQPTAAVLFNQQQHHI
jgi:hypothetical protein